MKRQALFALSLIPLLPGLGAAQHSYPYEGFHDNHDLQAFWDNVPVDSFTLQRDGTVRHFHSTLQLYGKSPGMEFSVSARVFLKDGTEVLDRTFEIEEGILADSLTTDMGYSNGFFRIIHRVGQLPENPHRIVVTLRSPGGERTRDIKCRYHRLSGAVTDFEGRPFRAIVSVRPDAFHDVTSVWTNEQGQYEMTLPERTYNAIYVDEETYAVSTLEAWGWHIVMNEDQSLDFKVGTGEVHNLNVWSNNGGFYTYFLSFRPMVLLPDSETESGTSTVTMNEREFEVVELAPSLEIEDVTVRINGEEVPILSLQKYYETGSDRGIVSYLLQVDKRGTSRHGRITVEVEYEKEMEMEGGGETVVQKSMGIYQLLPNFAGMSPWH